MCVFKVLELELSPSMFLGVANGMRKCLAVGFDPLYGSSTSQVLRELFVFNSQEILISQCNWSDGASCQVGL